MLMTNNNNIYMPFKAKIKEAVDIGGSVKLFNVVPENKTDYIPGQFFMVSLWGAGEVPISVTSTKGFQKHIEFGIKKVGAVTSALHKLKKGDIIWLRGPYGNGFRTDIANKHDIMFIAGGIGIVPLRSLINFVLINRKQYGKISLLYGSKNPIEILFKKEIKAWSRKGVEVILTVDMKDKNWEGNAGLVTEHIGKVKADFKNTFAYICGPDTMIRNIIKELLLRGMPDRQIAASLEARMKCGMGKCGQCYHGSEYICTNGPVYTYEEIKKRKVYGP
jgi:NAD(P)H-flavin reductase